MNAFYRKWLDDIDLGGIGGKMCADPVAKLTEALDAYAMDPGICITDLLFPLPTHKAERSRRRAGARRV